MWRLPLNNRLREQLKSPIADMRNTGDRFGGAITAGLFLKTFAKDTPWVHVDIAGPASRHQLPALAAQGRHRVRGRDDRRVRDPLSPRAPGWEALISDFLRNLDCLPSRPG